MTAQDWIEAPLYWLAMIALFAVCVGVNHLFRQRPDKVRPQVVTDEEMQAIDDKIAECILLRKQA